MEDTMMENKDQNLDIGKKIEDALASDDFAEFEKALESGDPEELEKLFASEEFAQVEKLIEMPSEETFAKWVELGEEKYRKRVARKKILSICAVVLIVCICSVIAIKCFEPPKVDAGPESKIQIDDSMDRTITYEAWEDLPDDIKDTFIEVKDLPDGYEVEKIVVKEGANASNVEITIEENKQKIAIRESLCLDGSLTTNIVAEQNIIEIIDGKELYVEVHEDINGTTYKYSTGKIMVDIFTTNTVEESVIKDIIKTVQ